jgi:DNA-directed RNA polymerase specialized sigma24 family protein
LAWLTLVLKRRCWRIREARRHEVGELLPGAETEAGRWTGSPPDPGATVVDLEEARARLRGLKPDERTAIGLAAAGYSYGEIAERRAWTKTYADLRVMPTWVRKPSRQAALSLERSA